jgi:hypothetical protein
MNSPSQDDRDPLGGSPWSRTRHLLVVLDHAKTGDQHQLLFRTQGAIRGFSMASGEYFAAANAPPTLLDDVGRERRGRPM